MIDALVRASRALLAVLASLALVACQLAPVAPVAPPAPAPAPPPQETGRVAYQPVAFAAVPGWTADAQDAAWPALLAGCRALVGAASTRDVWAVPCSDAAALPAPDTATARAFLEAHFTAYAVTDAGGRDTGLVTGYYEPLLAG